MASTFYIKRHDLEPAIQPTLSDQNGAIDLTNATTVRYSMWPERTLGSPTVNRQTATIVTAASGIVKYAWQSGDTATAGRYSCEWEITWNTGRIQTVPSDGYDLVVITADGDNT